MRVLIIHQNFPGQFRHLAQAWAQRPGWQVLGIGRDTCPGLPPSSGVRWIKYKPPRGPRADQHHYLRKMEDAVLHGQAVLRVLLQLRRKGFVPDVILAHPGWGETLYVKDVFPGTRLVHLCEWFYGNNGTEQGDLGFDPEFPATLDDHARVRTWNALHLLNLENCDAGVCPTQWQKSRHPASYQSKLLVIHEGIDTELLGPDPQARFNVPGSGLTFTAGDREIPVITYVARNLEPYRGFHSFMRALEIIQREHKTCHAVIVGGDDVSYGRKPKDAANWREKMLRECKVDLARTHFVGKLPYDQYRKVLQVSAAHVYLTYPFVLSWSMLEAMASGCLVIGSRTAPVQEVVVDGYNGLAADFLDIRDIAAKTLQGLKDDQSHINHRTNALTQTRETFSRDAAISNYELLL